MSDGLPEGLVTSTVAIREDIGRVDRVALEDVMLLWRVYSANRNLLSNDVGRRLENFFWRIWSNDKIRHTLTGTQVAALFAAISEGGIIRTTPTSSPRSSRLVPARHVPRLHSTASSSSSGSDSGRSSSSGSSGSSGSNNNDGATTNAHGAQSRSQAPSIVEEEKGRSRGSSRPPPILKKPGMDPALFVAKTARILTPTWKTARSDPDHDETTLRRPPGTPFLPRPSAETLASRLQPMEQAPADCEPTLPSPTSPPPSALAAGTLGASSESIDASRAVPSTSTVTPSTSTSAASTSTNTTGPKSVKKPAAIFTASSSKRRPTKMRRKSSTNSTSASSPRLTSRPSFVTPTGTSSSSAAAAAASSSGHRFRRSRSPRPATPGPRPTSRSASPVSTVPFHRSRDHRSTPDALVDPDFRSKFADLVGTRASPFGAASMKARAVVALGMGLEGTALSGAGSEVQNPRQQRGGERSKGKEKEEGFGGGGGGGIGRDGGDAASEERSALTAEQPPGPALDDEDGLGSVKSQLSVLLVRDRKTAEAQARAKSGESNREGKQERRHDRERAQNTNRSKEREKGPSAKEGSRDGDARRLDRAAERVADAKGKGKGRRS